MEYVKNISEERKEVDFLLFGEIGRQIDGNLFAHEMSMFSEFETFNIHINSVGGSIIQGNSIIAAMDIARNKGISIRTINRGIADSMAGIILANGDQGNREALDFSSGLVHEPLVQNSKGELVRIDQLEDGDTKNELLAFKTSLLTVLENSTGKSANELKAIMENDTRLDADALVSNGFVDRVVVSSNRPVINMNMSAVELMAACSSVNKKTKTMKVAKLLNLSDEASDESVYAVIQDLKNKAEEVDSLKAEKKEAVDKADALNTEVEELKTKVLDLQSKEVAAFVDAYIEKGTFSKDNRETLIVDASANFDLFKNVANSVTEKKSVQVADLLNTGSSAEGSKETKMVELYNKHDHAGTLEDFKNEVGDEKYTDHEQAYIKSL